MRSSGQDVSVFAGDLACGCGFDSVVDWMYDPEFDRSSTYTACPDCLQGHSKPTSYGVF